mgnify:CR=1 FL=1
MDFDENGRAIKAAGTLGASGHILGEYMIADGSVLPKYTLGISTEDILNGNSGYVTDFGLVTSSSSFPASLISCIASAMSLLNSFSLMFPIFCIISFFFINV